MLREIKSTQEYINIGIAVDTQEGLVVPVIKDANLMELESLDAAVSELASKARSKKLRNNDLEGQHLQFQVLKTGV